MFDGIHFIKSNAPFVSDYTTHDPAPLFRRKFFIPDDETCTRARLAVCGLGYGYYYLNGKRVSEDLFTAPISDYRKTLWYNCYDVTALIKAGENVAGVIAGNGFYNESLDTPWNLNKAEWRDQPKFIYNLEIYTDKKSYRVVSDENWKTSMESPVTYHQIHNGEYFDATKYDKQWNMLQFDDSNWTAAVIDDNPPTGIFRECLCEPIREAELFKTRNIIQTERGTSIFDIGQNISGYIRLSIRQPRGTKITIRYGEQLTDRFEIEYNNMNLFYPTSSFETDSFVCSGGDDTWSPMFAYHGFRYIELDGLQTHPNAEMVAGVFVHQAVKETSDFECSDNMLNQIYKNGKISTLSNLFYMPTDCPTREKLGWTNDAQASANQMYMNFDIRELFKKWMVDIDDSINDEGSLPGIVPSSGWGYGCGPVADGILFEIPYKHYLFTGDDSLLMNHYEHFQRYLQYMRRNRDENGYIAFSLGDWAGPFEDMSVSGTSKHFISSVFYIHFLRITGMTAERLNLLSDQEALQTELQHSVTLFQSQYIKYDGTCLISEQTAIAMVICYHLYDNLQPLKSQLLEEVIKHQYHHHCGMVGLRHLYYALDTCGCSDIAYRIITREGYPGYALWLSQGATTLWETWQPYNSKNHHMYSDVLYWFMSSLLGIKLNAEEPGFRSVVISPAFVEGLNYCKGWVETVSGRIMVSWEKNMDREEIFFSIKIPEGVRAVLYIHGCAVGLEERTVPLIEGENELSMKYSGA